MVKEGDVITYELPRKKRSWSTRLRIFLWILSTKMLDVAVVNKPQRYGGPHPSAGHTSGTFWSMP